MTEHRGGLKVKSLFLIGGGWRPEGRSVTYGRFIRASRGRGELRILLVMASETEEGRDETSAAYTGVFESLGVSRGEIVPFFVSDTEHLSADAVAAVEPTGIFVCGGLTPLYHRGVCTDMEWLEYAASRGIPYGGFSAGAAIAAGNAILGGWKIHLDRGEMPVLDPDLAEDLEFLEVQPGLGLTDFAVDVHASQWGTVTRLMHAVDQGMVSNGCAIDEDTMLQITGGIVTVFGLGQAYLIRKVDTGRLLVEIFRHGGRMNPVPGLPDIR